MFNKKKVESLESEAVKLKEEISRLENERVNLLEKLEDYTVTKVELRDLKKDHNDLLKKTDEADSIINEYKTVNGYIKSFGENASVAVMMDLVKEIKMLTLYTRDTAAGIDRMLWNQAQQGAFTAYTNGVYRTKWFWNTIDEDAHNVDLDTSWLS